jgi:hypothetical protein
MNVQGPRRLTDGPYRKAPRPSAYTSPGLDELGRTPPERAPDNGNTRIFERCLLRGVVGLTMPISPPQGPIWRACRPFGGREQG